MAPKQSKVAPRVAISPKLRSAIAQAKSRVNGKQPEAPQPKAPPTPRSWEKEESSKPDGPLTNQLFGDKEPLSLENIKQENVDSDASGSAPPASEAPVATSEAAVPKAGKNRRQQAVLDEADQHRFQSWLQKERKIGTAKAVEYSLCTSTEARRKFHSDWQVMKSQATNTVQQSRTNSQKSSTGELNDLFTRFEIADLEKIPHDSPIMAKILAGLNKFKNRKPELADIEEMSEYNYTKQLKRKFEEVDSKDTALGANADLTAEQAEKLENSMDVHASISQKPGKQKRTLTPSHGSDTTLSAEEIAAQQVAENFKKLKNLHRSMVSEQTLSQQYLIKLKATTEPWAAAMVLKLTNAVSLLAKAAEKALIAVTNGQETAVVDAIQPAQAALHKFKDKDGVKEQVRKLLGNK